MIQATDQISDKDKEQIKEFISTTRDYLDTMEQIIDWEHPQKWGSIWGLFTVIQLYIADMKHRPDDE